MLITNKPSWSKSSIHKLGKKMRDGEEYDVELWETFIGHHSCFLEALLGIMMARAASLNFDAANVSEIKPGTRQYFLTGRVKTRLTTIEKLRRMGTTPLENIQDITGLRFDCDMNLQEQSDIATYFKEVFLELGAKKVDIRDLREDPHRGYRAIHLRIFCEAGNAELQVRTALQAKWANLYELMGDIFGREIRYLQVEELSEEIRTSAEMAQQLSDLIYDSEARNSAYENRGKLLFIYEKVDGIVRQLAMHRNQAHIH
ncbi:MAG: hypothetical protein Q4D85_09415 [Corynebacterium sp.]|uniref:hypothetical protein n=1 Tax=Corynebacterium sp. TaxID=1720 RepID=UPI0026DAB32C|nr:hypothetical protein [Corynebacterium sp.]MDO5098967.1 hypothetical protein [Corynebacterium sp.]